MTITGWIVLAVIAGFVVYVIKRMGSSDTTTTVVDSTPEKIEGPSNPVTVDTPAVVTDAAPVETVAEEVKVVETVKKPAAKKAPAKRKPAAKKPAAKASK